MRKAVRHLSSVGLERRDLLIIECRTHSRSRIVRKCNTPQIRSVQAQRPQTVHLPHSGADIGSWCFSEATDPQTVEEEIAHCVSCRTISRHQALMEIEIAVAVGSRVRAPITFSITNRPRKYLETSSSSAEA